MIIRFKNSSNTQHFAKRIRAVAEMSGLEYTLTQEGDIYLQMENLEEFGKLGGKYIYNSIFFEGVDAANSVRGGEIADIPLSVGVCQNCIEEMLDADSRRYYYPFTGCSSCSNQYAFFQNYPFERKNTLMAVFRPCKECLNELEKNPLRKDYHLISCIECNIPVVLRDKKSEFWASEADDYRKIFKIAANALRDGKSVAIKTLNGYKRFFLNPKEGLKLMICDLEEAKKSLLLLDHELKALFSIERPEIYATLTSDNLKKSLGPVATLKAFDDGFTLLLTKEFAGEDFIFFDEGKEADLVMDYMLETNTLKETHLFFNRHHKFISKGERGILPQNLLCDKTVFYKNYLLHNGILDIQERFGEVLASSVVTFEEDVAEHPIVVKKDAAAAALRAVMREHGIKEDALGLYFGDEKRVYYIKEDEEKTIFEFGDIKPNLLKRMENLREGSFKLVKKYTHAYGDGFEKSGDFWKICAALTGQNGGFERLNRLAMGFGGKGGVSVDCKIVENRFDYESFFASLMSYRLAGVDSVLLAYSIFESLGEFLSGSIKEVGLKTGVTEFLIAGPYIANSAFFSRFVKNLPMVKTNKSLPVDGLNTLLGV